jgi:hypothetical protein
MNKTPKPDPQALRMLPLVAMYGFRHGQSQTAIGRVQTFAFLVDDLCFDEF